MGLLRQLTKPQRDLVQDGDLREHDQEPGVPPAQDGLGDDRGLTVGELRPATEADAAAVTRLVDDAYGHYVQRLGLRPGPMREDYGDVIRNRDATVVERGGTIVGLLVRGPTDEGFVIENVAVHPTLQGHGLGRALIELAEADARGSGFDSIYLYTHEKMAENQALYASLGYEEYERRGAGDLVRVFMRKRLS